MEAIAVLTAPDGLLGSALEPGTLTVWQRREKTWAPQKALNYVLSSEDGLRGVRAQLHGVVSQLEDTRVLLAKDIRGLPYQIFDSAGFSLVEMTGTPEDNLPLAAELLVQWAKEDAARQAVLQQPVQPEPAGQPGHFTLNLSVIQRERPDLTSKGVLLPFLRGTAFDRLTITCSHAPPWLKAESERLGYAYAEGTGCEACITLTRTPSTRQPEAAPETHEGCGC